MPPVTGLSRSSSTSTTASSSRTLSKPPRRARKAFAYRSPSASSSSADGVSSQGKRYSPYPAPPEPSFLFDILDSSSPLESEYLLAGSNTRYPGAPGTALWKAREAATKAQQAAQREADKKRRAKEELARLGVDEKLGAKRSRDSASKRSESPYVSNGASNGKTPRRRGAKGPVAAVKEVTGRASTSRASSVARSTAAQEPTSLLAVPPTTAANASSNGRVRKPASRGNSPVPLTAAPATTRRVADAPRIPLGNCRTQAQFNRKDGQNMPTSQLGASSFLARSPESQGAMP